MARIFNLWRDITEGHTLHQLWIDFKREARSSVEASAPGLPAGTLDQPGWRRWWAIARALFFRLSPGRRVLLLVDIVFLFSVRSGSGDPPQGTGDNVLLAAHCFLVLLALDVADRVSLKRDLELARDIQGWLVPHAPPAVPGADLAFGTRPANRRPPFRRAAFRVAPADSTSTNLRPAFYCLRPAPASVILFRSVPLFRRRVEFGHSGNLTELDGDIEGTVVDSRRSVSAISVTELLVSNGQH